MVCPAPNPEPESNGRRHRRDPVKRQFRRADFVWCAIVILLAGCDNPDRAVRRRVVDRLGADPVASQHEIDVRVTSSVATVSGQMRSGAAQAHVLTLVAATDGVLDVINNLRVADDALVEAVRRAIMADPLVKDVPVSVVCRDGEVTLSSNQTNADQRARLVKLAGGVDGIVRVVDAMK